MIEKRQLILEVDTSTFESLKIQDIFESQLKDFLKLFGFRFSSKSISMKRGKADILELKYFSPEIARINFGLFTKKGQ